MSQNVEKGKVSVNALIEEELYKDVIRASVAIGSPGIVREALIYFLCQMGFHQVTDFESRFKYVAQQRAVNDARNLHSTGLRLLDVLAARRWMLATEKAKKEKDLHRGAAILVEESNSYDAAVYDMYWHRVSDEMGPTHQDGTFVSAFDVTEEVKSRLMRDE